MWLNVGVKDTVILFTPDISDNWEVLSFCGEGQSGKIFILFCDVFRELFKTEKM